jgi:hypothetical protein
MLPICQFLIGEGAAALRLTIHSFPSDTMKDRIPPASQIARWRQQFDSLNPGESNVLPISSGGFTGFFFEGSGILQGQPATVLGWSMQMAPEQYQNLQNNTFEERQRRADYTLKVQGSSDIIQQNKEDIWLFASSFELIEEIPSR